MKKSAAILIAIIAFLISAFTLTACRSCKSCKVDHPTKEELIPESLGEPEGLWLYKGNTRSRTDGSEKQTLMTSVTVNGEEYDIKNFSISDICYVTSTNKIFFVLYQNGIKDLDTRFLYLFDYKEKTGKYLCPLSARTEIKKDEDNNLVYVSNDEDKILLDYEGNILYRLHEGDSDYEKYDYYFSGYSNGVLYSSYRHSYVVEVAPNEPERQYDYYIEWWVNGKTHKIQTPEGVYKHEVTITDTHLFILYCEEITSINLTTEALTKTDFGVIDYDSTAYVSARRYIKQVCYGDGAYVLSLAYFTKNDENEDKVFYFHKIQDDGCTEIQKFNYENYGHEMHEYNGSIYLKFRIDGRDKASSYRYYRYDIKSGKLSSISLKNFRGPSDTNKVTYTHTEIRVGEYRFYVSSKGYGYSGYLWGYEGSCCYLNREYRGQTEIMQYSFDSSYFFDDICDF